MENNLKFSSAVCTSRVQSERLLALGLKKETADMCWLDHALTEDYEDWRVTPIFKDWEEWQKNGILAWSLHRLIEIMPSKIKVEDNSAYLAMNNNIVTYLYYYEDYAEMSSCIDFYMGKNIYDNLIYCIKWLINEGRFSKEYIQ